MVKTPQGLQSFRSRVAPYDYMLCIDLEATCDEVEDDEPDRMLLINPAEMEIIEIGLAVLDLRSLVLIDSFQSYVRPVLHPILTPFCINLTSIQQSDVDAADRFVQVSKQVTNFLDSYPGSVWGSWGRYDADQLRTDATRARCTPAFLNLEHIDMANVYEEVFKGSAPGLRPAAEALGLIWKGRYHRGIDDALNLARIAAFLLEKARSLS